MGPRGGAAGPGHMTPLGACGAKDMQPGSRATPALYLPGPQPRGCDQVHPPGAGRGALPHEIGDGCSQACVDPFGGAVQRLGVRVHHVPHFRPARVEDLLGQLQLWTVRHCTGGAEGMGALSEKSANAMRRWWHCCGRSCAC